MGKEADKLGAFAGGSLFFVQNMKFQLTIFHLLLFISCSSNSNDVQITEEEILKRLSAIDPKVRLLPDNPEVVGCKNYIGCRKFIRAFFGNIEIFLVEMNSERIAKEYSHKKDALHLGNWLFDNIQRENRIKSLILKVIELDPNSIVELEPKKDSH